jgi:stage II sporulation protein M
MEKIISYYKQLFTDNREWLERVFIWFLVSFIIGGIIFYYDQSFLAQITKVFADKFGSQPSLNFNFALSIFSQNLTVSIIAVLGGLILGIAPFAIVAANGIILGYIITSIISLSNQSRLDTASFILGGLVPHGIFELPAFFLAAALGLKLGTNWLRRSAAGNRLKVLKQDFISALVYFPSIALLLFVAALIEVFVSGNFVK